MPRKLLVTGGNWPLIRSLYKVFQVDGEWNIYCGWSSDQTNVENLIQINLTNRDSVHKVISSLKPDVVIHCPAVTIEESEKNESEAEKEIVNTTENLASVSTKVGAWCIFISSDYVFDGTHGPYASNAECKPINKYGNLYRQAELIFWKNQTDGGILRVPTTYLFGNVTDLKETNVTKIASIVFDNKTQVELDDTRIEHPTYTDDVAIVCRGLAERKMEHCGLYGTWHWSGNSPLTAYQIALRIANLYKVSHGHIKINNNTTQLPKNTELNCIALTVMGLGKQTPIDDALSSVIAPFVPTL